MCEHKKFFSTTEITRLTTEQGKVKGFVLELHVACEECGQSFEFIGPSIPLGLSSEFPTVSLDGTEIRLPIKPSTYVPDPLVKNHSRN